MKTIYLIRHAKSSWENDQLTDFERPLNERGKKDAPRMARRLKEKEITPDIFITSPAKRTSRTCREFARVFNFPKTAIKKVEELYHASPETILKVLQRINEKYDLVLLFGHNPGLTEFAEWLTSKNLLNIPTCGIVGIKLQIKFWKDIDPGKARLLLFDFPKKYNGRNGN